MKTETKTGRFTKGLVIGALIGAAVGLLVAPQPGRQTRNMIRSKTGGYAGSLRERFRRNDAVSEITDHAESRVEVSG